MLIIIDMQPKFGAAEPILDNVVRELRKAISRKEVVVLAEYECICWEYDEGLYIDECPQCLTFPEIREVVQNYEKGYIVVKQTDDGSREIFDLGLRFPKNVKFCGVNTDACVKETVQSFASKFLNKTHTLLLDACNCFSSRDAAISWTHFFQNVKVV